MHHRMQNGSLWRSSKTAEVRLCLCLGIYLKFFWITSVRFQDCSQTFNADKSSEQWRCEPLESLGGIFSYVTVKNQNSLGGEAPSGLKIIFGRWPVMLTGQSNFSSVTSRFWPIKILKKKKLSNVGLIKLRDIICLFQSLLDRLKIGLLQRKA